MSILDRLARLDGLIPEEVGLALLALATDVDAGHSIVEVGSYKGKSTCYLAVGAAAGWSGGPVYAVDPWDLEGNETGRFGYAEPETFAAFQEQVTSFDDIPLQVVPCRGFSADVAPIYAGPPVGLLYIDGDHTAAGVRADFRAWRDHLPLGATVAFDDYGTERNPGVREVVDALGYAGTLEECNVHAGRLAVGTFRG